MDWDGEHYDSRFRSLRTSRDFTSGIMQRAAAMAIVATAKRPPASSAMPPTASEPKHIAPHTMKRVVAFCRPCR
jgi:hypothetical protein